MIKTWIDNCVFIRIFSLINSVLQFNPESCRRLVSNELANFVKSVLFRIFFKAHRIISCELGRLKSITADQFEPLSVMYVESELKETLGRRAAIRNWPTLRKWRNVTWLGNVAARHKSVGKIREKGKYLSFPDEDNDDARFAASSHRRWNRP